MGLGQPGPSLIGLCCLIKANDEGRPNDGGVIEVQRTRGWRCYWGAEDQRMEADELNSVQIRVVVAACGVEIKFECGYTGRNEGNKENQVEIVILNKKFQECMYDVFFSILS